MVALLCTVRGCRQPLDRDGLRFVCRRGHSFDVARRGYVNLLQPQERRSAHPGDTAEAIRARARLMAHGPEQEILEEISALAPRAGEAAATLDVGCGDGTYLAAVVSRREGDAHGVDISVPAIDAAAAAHPALSWVVANADRFLPYADGSFDLVMSINARLNPAEFGRVLRPDGTLLVVVPGADDLVELRAAVLGEGRVRDRSDRVVRACEPFFALDRRHTIRRHARMTSDGLADVLLATYRGARSSQRARLASLDDALDVTFARDVVVFRPTPAAPDACAQRKS